MSELDLYHIVRLPGEDRAHEARVTARLDVGHDLQEVSLLPHHPLAGDVGVLRVNGVLEVPQLEAPLAGVDVELDGGV